MIETPSSASPESTNQPKPRMRRANRGSWVGGAVLILLGIIFLLQNQGLFSFENWWALFILIPALGSFGSAWSAFQDAGGYLDSKARSSLLFGILLTIVSAIFLFDLSWTYLGPALLILVGVSILVSGFLPKSQA